MQKEAVMSIPIMCEAVIEIADLIARCFELEAELADLKVRLLREIEQLEKS